MTDSEDKGPIRRALWVVGTACVVAGALAWVGGGWRAGVGMGVGVASIWAGTYLAVLRSASLRREGRKAARKSAVVGAQLGKFAVLLAVFWVVVHILQAPAWSLLGGVTVGVAGLVAGLLSAR